MKQGSKGAAPTIYRKQILSFDAVFFFYFVKYL